MTEKVWMRPVSSQQYPDPNPDLNLSCNVDPTVPAAVSGASRRLSALMMTPFKLLSPGATAAAAAGLLAPPPSTGGAGFDADLYFASLLGADAHQHHAGKPSY